MGLLSSVEYVLCWVESLIWRKLLQGLWGGYTYAKVFGDLFCLNDLVSRFSVDVLNSLCACPNLVFIKHIIALPATKLQVAVFVIGHSASSTSLWCISVACLNSQYGHDEGPSPKSSCAP